MWNYQLRKLSMMFCGILLMGFSVALMRTSDLGTDPYCCLNLGISNLLQIPFGILMICTNGILLLIALLVGKHLLGIGTVAYTVGMGLCTDFFTILLSYLPDMPQHWLERLLLTLIAVLLFAFSASLFFTSNLGVSPYDALGFILTQKLHVSYRWCHIVTEFICIIAGVALQSKVGIATLLTAFLIGPLVHFFNRKFSSPILNRRHSFQ